MDGTVFAEYHRPGTQRMNFSDTGAREQLVGAGRILTKYTIDSHGPVHADLWMATVLRSFRRSCLGICAAARRRCVVAVCTGDDAVHHASPCNLRARASTRRDSALM